MDLTGKLFSQSTGLIYIFAVDVPAPKRMDPDVSGNTLTFPLAPPSPKETQDISEHNGQIVLKCPDLIPAPQRMNPFDLNDSLTFLLAPPSGQTLHV